MANTKAVGVAYSDPQFESVTVTGAFSAASGVSAGTSANPVTVTTASNISSSYGSSSATNGDTRLSYNKLTFTAAGSGETLRAYTIVTAAGTASGGTVNGAHISLDINGSGTISGAANALRATLGGTSTNPGGTIAALQLDSNFASGGTWTNASFLRCTDSGTGTIGTFAQLPNALIGTKTSAAVSHVIPIKNASGTTYYIMVSNTL